MMLIITLHWSSLATVIWHVNSCTELYLSSLVHLNKCKSFPMLGFNLHSGLHFISIDPGAAGVITCQSSSLSNSFSKLCISTSCVIFNDLSAQLHSIMQPTLSFISSSMQLNFLPAFFSACFQNISCFLLINYN